MCDVGLLILRLFLSCKQRLDIPRLPLSLCIQLIGHARLIIQIDQRIQIFHTKFPDHTPVRCRNRPWNMMKPLKNTHQKIRIHFLKALNNHRTAGKCLSRKKRVRIGSHRNISLHAPRQRFIDCCNQQAVFFLYLSACKCHFHLLHVLVFIIEKGPIHFIRKQNRAPFALNI